MDLELVKVVENGFLVGVDRAEVVEPPLEALLCVVRAVHHRLGQRHDARAQELVGRVDREDELGHELRVVRRTLLALRQLLILLVRLCTCTFTDVLVQQLSTGEPVSYNVKHAQRKREERTLEELAGLLGGLREAVEHEALVLAGR